MRAALEFIQGDIPVPGLAAASNVARTRHGQSSHVFAQTQTEALAGSVKRYWTVKGNALPGKAQARIKVSQWPFGPLSLESDRIRCPKTQQQVSRLQAANQIGQL